MWTQIYEGIEVYVNRTEIIAIHHTNKKAFKDTEKF